MKDNVNHPEHYTQHPSGVECIDITRHYCFSIGNAIKYLWRAGLKKEEGLDDKQKEIEDLKKAMWYIRDRIKQLELNNDANGALSSYNYKVRHATEEEKAKLFQAIKDNGYKWNAEAKTLEKLTEFKDGDVAISDLGDIHLLRTKDSSYCAYRIRWTGLSKLDNTITTGVKVARLATEEEKHILFDSIKANGYRWNEETKSLEKLINKNKFVIGAIVTNGKIKGRICLRDGDSYVLEDGTHVFFNEVHNWELVPNKFDITTLKPFDKVLYRMHDKDTWCNSFYSFYKNNHHFVTSLTIVKQCIPYEDNKHLLGTTDDCDDFYKSWK